MIPWNLRFGRLAVLCVLMAGLGQVASATPVNAPPFTTPPVNGVPALSPPIDTPPLITPPAGVPPIDPGNGGVPVVDAPVDFENEDGHINIEITHPRSTEFSLTGAFLSIHLHLGDNEGADVTHADAPFNALATTEFENVLPADLEALFGSELVLDGAVFVAAGGGGAGTQSIVVIPEPASGLLLGAGLIGLALGRPTGRRHR